MVQERGDLGVSFFDFLDIDEETQAILFLTRAQAMTDTAFVGILHKELIRGQGWQRTRSTLMRLGFAAGYSDCQFLRKAYAWRDDDHLLRAGIALHSFKGIARTRLARIDADRTEGTFRIEGAMDDSLEAGWHRQILGAAPAPVCWLHMGYLTGFLSAWWGDEVLVKEVECAGTGRQPKCRFEAQPASVFGESEKEDLDIFRYPDLGEDLSKMADLPILPKPASSKDGAGAVMNVFQTARRAGIIGRSKAMERSLKLALQVAVTDATVLLVGESGTGKELFARLIHEMSPRTKDSFLAVNCSALPETLLESELFGHVKGAFTGAAETRKGLCEAAGGGTILLDEIGEMTPATQVKLLRVLQDKEVRPVGGNRGTPVDIRIIAATNRDLDQMVADGSFREDLYYRLKVFPITVPPLRQRREDVVPLARHFLSRFSQTTGKKVNTLSPGTLKALSAYPWPGNVRELENVLERAVVLTTHDRIQEEDLPHEIGGRNLELPHDFGDDTLVLRDVEKRHILRVLAREGGHRQKTAKSLGIGVNTLWRKLKEYGVEGAGRGGAG
ncbi:MAG: sigma 54-interacting transcriptional regulator [Planctomycetota bacterium]